MSDIHEESLLSESMSLEDLDDADSSSAHYDEQIQKFGIVNTNNLAKDANASGDDAEKLDKEVLVFCDRSSNDTGTLKNGQGYTSNTPCSNHMPTSSDSYHCHSSSSCSGVEDMKEQSFSYFDNVDNTSLLTTSSDSVQIHGLMQSSTMSKDWVLFDDNNFSCNDGSLSSVLPRKPPDIPRRLGLPTADQIHANVSQLTVKSVVPPIPNRVYTPQQTSSLMSSNNEFRIPPPPLSSNSSLKRYPRSRSSVSTPSQTYESAKSPATISFGPPIPPRKDILHRKKERDSVSDLSRTSDTSSLHGWIKFEHAGSSQDELLESGSLCTNRTTPSQLLAADDYCSSVSSLNADSSIIDTSSAPKESDPGDPSKWVTSSSPDSPKSNKKKKKGYQHLSSGSEEDDAEKASVLAGDEITIEVTDLSPAKPLSRWALMRNETEDKSGSSGDISARNSMLDPHDELDLDDAFGLGDDRLSTDGSGLKGFNRADKGSQNNLVDFSESTEQLDNSSGEQEGSSENELETVFDMTAQGDSLKRRRKKKANSDSTPSPRLLQSTSSAASSAKQLCDSATLDSSAETKPLNLNTNPFWRHSPMGDTISLTSSASESNPFDRVQFQTVNLPSNSSTPLVKSTKASHIPTLPPPPKSSKQRTLSSSLGRPRPVNDSSPLSFSLPQSVATQEELRRTSSVSSSPYECKLDSSVNTPLKSDSVSLLDLAEESSVDYASAIAESSTSLQHRRDDVMASKVSVEEPAGTSKKESKIFETALQILDVSPKSPPLSLNNPDINAHPVLTEFPNIKSDSFSPLGELLKKPLPDSPVQTEISVLKRLKRESLISNRTDWEMLMRFPREKHAMSSRKWVPIYVKLNMEKVDHPTLQLFHNTSSQTPFYYVPLNNHEFQLSNPTLRPRFNSSKGARRGCVSSEGLNPKTWRPEMREVAYYNATKRKVHCVKLLQIHYKEKRAFSTKKDKYMTRIPSGFKHSIKKKQVVKLGTENHADLLSFVLAVTDISFNANSIGKNEKADDHCPTVKYHSKDEIMFQVKDEFLGEMTSNGVIEACDVIVHVYVTSFLTGDPLATVTFNNKKVEGKEVVRRSDIIPVSGNNWIEMSDIEVHRCSPRGYEEERAAITFHPPDACRFELARFRCPYIDKESPLIVRPTISVQGHRVTLRCVVRTSARIADGEDPMFQVPCDDVSVRFFIPDSWVPAFRRVGFGGYKSIHATRVIKPSPGREKVLGGTKIVRCHAAIEASLGSGKYEAAFDALVWRIKRLPEKNAVSNTPQVLMCVVELETEEQVAQLDFPKYRTCEVEYTMPWCTASNTCIRSVSLPNCTKAEKFTTYGAHFLYKVEIGLNREGSEVSNCAVQ